MPALFMLPMPPRTTQESGQRVPNPLKLPFILVRVRPACWARYACCACCAC